MLRNRKLLIVLTGVLLMGLVIAGCGQSASTSGGESQPYKVGAVFDISGKSSSLGIPERDTALMVVDEINKNGGINGHKLELII